MLPAVRLKAENNKRKTSLIRLDERGFLVAASGFEPLTLRVCTECSGQLSYAAIWLRGKDLTLRPPGYEPDELPDCSTPRHLIAMSDNKKYHTMILRECQAFFCAFFKFCGSLPAGA